MRSLSPVRYYLFVFLLALSFWSSGVMLIRWLDSMQAWSAGSVQLALVYGLSVPIILVSIRGVHNLFTQLFLNRTGAVYQITGLVLMLHALAITLFPTLYGFTLTTPLVATAWLLWFGGVVLLLQTRKN